jgi:hypothetical protein
MSKENIRSTVLLIFFSVVVVGWSGWLTTRVGAVESDNGRGHESIKAEITNQYKELDSKITKIATDVAYIKGKFTPMDVTFNGKN